MKWASRLAALLAVSALLVACSDDDDRAPAACIVVGGAPAPMPLFVPPDPSVPLAQVSGTSPFATGCGRETVCGTVYVGSEVEPFVSANPLDAGNLVGVWQQDRWSNGGAQGLLAAFSTDGGQTWSARQAPFSRCSGGNALNGGDYARATDPWVSFGANGSVYWMAMAITDLPSGEEVSAMLVSRSTDGGYTWDAPITLIQDTTPFFNDKNAITADPTDGQYTYAVWDRLDFSTNTGPAYLARTTDGGATWEQARVLYDPGAEAQTVGNQVVVLPDGTLLNLFTEIHYGTPTVPDTVALRVVRSIDKGATWLPPVTVADMLGVGVDDPESGTPIRSGGILGTIAVAPDGGVWVAWEDARHSSGDWNGIVLSLSIDSGLTWGSPVLVTDPGAAAFTPTLAAAADGTLGLTYYDQRDNTPDPRWLLTGYWLATSADGLDWSERRISGPFDHGIAPYAYGLFLGDYAGLAAAGDSFVPFFAQTHPDLSDRTNIYAVALPATVTTVAKALQVRRAVPLGPVAMSAEWARKTGALIEKSRHHFPDRPGQLPAYLR